jgi:hypothetical protein
MAPSPSTLRIRELNDAMRRAIPEVDPNNRVVFTRGAAALSPLGQIALAILVRDFAAFTPDNDPHGEHDFGGITLQSVRYLWKIDYFDRSMTLHSPDPSDPDVTSRVLTIMRADEY